MISVKLMGGLGNQMFQYAAGRALALRQGTELQIDLTWLEGKQNVATPREYELGCFSFSPVFFGSSNQAETTSLIIRLFGRKPKLQLVREPASHVFDPRVLRASDNSYLEGYWQSEKYFEDQAEVIRQDFTFAQEPTGKNEKLLEEIQSAAAISLHVRRGDYATDPATQEFHGLIPLDYYDQAVELIVKRAKLKVPRLFVFSDDPAWCREHLKLDYPTTYVSHNTGRKSFEDMRLISACHHQVIANSSFSWWGAWLNSQPKKIVVAPKRWFKDESVDTTDLIPEAWIKL
jgi:hypothetical protein